MSDIHISVDIPPDASPAEKKALRAGAFQTGLSLAAADPGMRLQMILGEAWQKHCELVSWVADQLDRDEEKAPGLWKLAWDGTGFPGGANKSSVRENTKLRLLQEAVAELVTRRRLVAKAAGTDEDGPDLLG